MFDGVFVSGPPVRFVVPRMWAEAEGFKNLLIRIGSFVFEYLAIHPFQGGNGRADATRFGAAGFEPLLRMVEGVRQ